jgi:hypothetical protein
MSESPVSRRFPWLAYGLFALAGGLVANSLFGPLVSETIRYHYSDSLLNQGIGLDAVALLGRLRSQWWRGCWCCVDIGPRRC